MITFKKSLLANKRNRPDKNINIIIDEKLEFGNPVLRNERDKVKHIKRCEFTIRKSIEYRDYIRFLKKHMDMNKCIVLQNLKNGDGRKYSIEIHHEPFTLFDIVDIVLNRRIKEGKSIHDLDIADEVMDLHYSNMIGLIPLTITMHEATHNDKIFIPLQYIYQRYDQFYNEYEPYIESRLIRKIDAKVKASLSHSEIASNSLNVNFVTVTVDGFNFPTIPEEWKDILSMNRNPEEVLEPLTLD